MSKLIICVAILSFFLVVSSSLVNTKQNSSTRVALSRKNKSNKSNKSNKRQEKVYSSSVHSKLVNLNEPEFDSYNMLPQISSSSSSSVSGGVYDEPIVSFMEAVSSRISNSLNMSVMLGQNVVLPCAVKNIGSFKILWLRVRDGDVLAYDDMIISQDPRFSLSRKSVNESNLKIQSVKASDSGEYACQINTQSLKAKLINLIIMTPPSFTDIDTDVKDESMDQYYTNTATAGTSTNNLVNKHANHLHHNHHNNHHSSQSKMHHLKTQKLLHHSSTSSSTKSISIVEGTSIELECNAFGIPKPDINWYVKRFDSSILTEYLLNSSKITVNNVARNQFDYFECEASNKIPPSVSKKFKIHVNYAPEINVSPFKVFVNNRNTPVQVRFNCSVDSYPESDVTWMFMSGGSSIAHKSPKKRLRKTIVLSSLTKVRRNNKMSEETAAAAADDDIDMQNNLVLTSKEKYSIYFQSINETHKTSMLAIDVENESDLGIYSCYANNSIGAKSTKFYIYGEINSAEYTTATTTVTTIKEDSDQTAESTNDVPINNYQYVSSSNNEKFDHRTLQNQNLNKKNLVIDDPIYLHSTKTVVEDSHRLSEQDSFISSTSLTDIRKSKETFVFIDSIFKSTSSNLSSFSLSSSSSTSFKFYFLNCFLLFLANVSIMTILS